MSFSSDDDDDQFDSYSEQLQLDILRAEIEQTRDKLAEALNG